MVNHTRNVSAQYAIASDNADDVEICLATTTKRRSNMSYLILTRAEALALITQLTTVLTKEPPADTEEGDQGSR